MAPFSAAAPSRLDPIGEDAAEHSPFLHFTREGWARLRAATPLTLSEDDLERLQGINEEVSMDEVVEVYLPISRLINLHVVATHHLHGVMDAFLGEPSARIPYVIGLAGSVAVGKSTTARILQALLQRWPDHPRVDLISTDGFLYPNADLQARGLMQRKGFPESYDLRRLVRFVSDLKSGAPKVTAPVYSHLTYDILPNTLQTLTQPDIVIVEGLNVLQSGADYPDAPPQVFVSDFFDFSVYVDSPAGLLEDWYVQRFLRLRETAFTDPDSYFHRYAHVSADEATATARRIWREINLRNLTQNIAPTRMRADLVLTKGAAHSVAHVQLRKR